MVVYRPGRYVDIQCEGPPTSTMENGYSGLTEDEVREYTEDGYTPKEIEKRNKRVSIMTTDLHEAYSEPRLL